MHYNVYVSYLITTSNILIHTSITNKYNKYLNSGWKHMIVLIVYVESSNLMRVSTLNFF
jgi:hypothetical protein